MPRIQPSEVERELPEVTEDVDVIRPHPRTKVRPDADGGLLMLCHLPARSSAARSRGVFASAFRKRSRSAPRSVTGPRRATPSVA